MTVFIKDNFIVDDELHEKRYYHVKCNQCDNEIGKKFVKSTDKYSNSYIAFGKEKLKYGDVTIEKNNYWTNFINLTYFKDMTRYKKYDFDDNIVEIKKSNSSRYVPPSHRLHDINSNNNNYNDNNNDGYNVGKNSFGNRIINSNNSEKSRRDLKYGEDKEKSKNVVNSNNNNKKQRDSSTLKYGEEKEKSKNVVLNLKMNYDNDENDDEDDDNDNVDDEEDSISLQPAKLKRQLPCPPQQPRKSHNNRVDEINQSSSSSLSSSLSIAVTSNQRVNVSNISLKKGPVVTERQDVGESVNDKVNFLKNKIEKWDADKLLYEFKGPNKKNWDKIISTVDMTGSLMDNVLELLAKSAIKDHVDSSELYSGLRSNSFTNINIYLSCLNVRVMQSKLKGCGSKEWIRMITILIHLVETISVTMRLFVDCQCTAPVDMISMHVTSLLGADFNDDTQNIKDFQIGLSDIIHHDCLLKSHHLYNCVQSIKRIRDGALNAAILHDEEKNLLEKEKSENSRLLKSRQRNGIKFLDDPKHDTDYLKSSVVPKAEELLSSAPSALPQNRVFSLNRKNYNIDDDDEDDNNNEITRTSNKKLRNSLEFRSIHHYLNTHFQLNKEDCLAQLRRGIKSYRDKLIASTSMGKNNNSNTKNDSDEMMFSGGDNDATDIIAPTQKDIENVAKAINHSRGDDKVYLYKNVNVESVEKRYDDIGYKISFELLGNNNRPIDWNRSSRFMTGSLLCLSNDGTFNENSFVIATVACGVDTKDKNQQSHPKIIICIDQDSLHNFNPLLTYIMIESTVFFDAYRPVLLALKKLGEDGDIPFANNLLGYSKKVRPPEFLFKQQTANLIRDKIGWSAYGAVKSTEVIVKTGWKMSHVFPNYELVNGTTHFDPLSSLAAAGAVVKPSIPHSSNLDQSQIDAILLALSHGLSLIQGPPGCGKTYVGVLISKILLSNKDIRARKPILFICQTNHALDQMLEHVYEFESNMIRIGSRSESEIMQSLSLDRKRADICKNNVRRTQEEYQAMGDMKAALSGLQLSISQKLNESFKKMSNSIIGRLHYLLKEINSNAQYLLENIVESSVLRYKTWKMCSDSASFQLSSIKQFLPLWVSDYEEWIKLNMEHQFLLMTVYSPHMVPSLLSEQSIIEHWKIEKTKKEKVTKKKLKATNDWQVVGGDDNKSNNNNIKAGYEDDTLDLLQDDFIDIDDMIEKLQRDIDDGDYDEFKEKNDDDDMFFSSTNYLNLSTHEEYALNSVRTRKVDQKEILENLREKLSSSQINLLFKEDKFSDNDRHELVEIWKILLEIDAFSDIEKYTKAYRQAAKIEANYKAKVDSNILKTAAVIGMTTNGAAKYNLIMRTLQPEVIIVEEAAEVLEASIISAFTNKTQHVILIGDHQQLRPQVQEYSLANDNGLEISLFERLIRMGLPHVTLTTQRRMHPEISSLITPSIYRHLDNAPSVELHPVIQGIRDRLYFISHEVPEDNEDTSRSALASLTGTEMSKTNTYEAKYLLKLLQYLLYNGYKSKNIVILSMYKGQLQLIRKLSKDKSFNHVNNGLFQIDTLDTVRMTTTDNYQGEESDIILLSLVRSNKDNKSGFVKIHNRICVALSRARNGMYVIGNFKMFQETSDLWLTICKQMKARNRIGNSLVLECPNHKNQSSSSSSISIQHYNDFDKCPHGGCMLPCKQIMKCQHICQLLCHPINHDYIKCNQECTKPRPIGCNHKCPKPCWEDCGLCLVKVKKVRTFCNHEINISCSSDINSIICPIKCGFLMLCNHNCPEVCHPNGHDQLRYRCPLPCQRLRTTCSHPCIKSCYDICGDCTIKVKKTVSSCGHEVEMECSMDPTNFICMEPCTKKLSCGHFCLKKCSEVCDIKCQNFVMKEVGKCDKLPKHKRNILCSHDPTELICEQSCKEMLACGHKCHGNCQTCKIIESMTILDNIDNTEAQNDEVDNNYNANYTVSNSSHNDEKVMKSKPMRIIQHQNCQQKCEKRLLCNHKCNGSHFCGDESTCPPCSNKCILSCVHQICDNVCTENCKNCDQQCSYQCLHYKCQSKCGTSHDLIPNNNYNTRSRKNNNKNKLMKEFITQLCQEPCSLKLKCGHPCLGVCGEECPRICWACNPLDINSTLSIQCLSTYPQKVIEDTPLFIMLQCKHIFEVTAMDMYMQQFDFNSNNNEKQNDMLCFQIPFCPECKNTVLGSYRYDRIVREAFNRLHPFQIQQTNEYLMTEIIDAVQSSESLSTMDSLSTPSTATSDRATIIENSITRLRAMLSAAASSHGMNSNLDIIYYLLGQLYLYKQNFSEAMKCFKAITDRFSDNNNNKSKSKSPFLYLLSKEVMICMALCQLRAKDFHLSRLSKISSNQVDLMLAILQKNKITETTLSNLHQKHLTQQHQHLTQQQQQQQSVKTLFPVSDESIVIIIDQLKQRKNEFIEEARKRQEQLQLEAQRKMEQERQDKIIADMNASNTTGSPSKYDSNSNDSNDISCINDNSNNNRNTIKIRVPSNQGSALHEAACRGNINDIRNLLAEGPDLFQQDNNGNTPLLLASLNGHSDVIEILYPISPWHTINKNLDTFLDIILKSSIRVIVDPKLIERIEELARNVLIDDPAIENFDKDGNKIIINPSHSWAASKHYESVTSDPMDKLMDMIGIRKVKLEALSLFHAIRKDMKRPIKARICTKQALNFQFLGNPGKYFFL